MWESNAYLGVCVHISVNVQSASVFRSGTQYVFLQVCVSMVVNHIFYVIVYMMSVYISLNDCVLHCV
jgi:hypothetical protein